MNYIKIKDLSEPKKGVYGIGASAVNFNTEYPRYLRITDIREDSTIPSVLPTCIDPSKYKNWQNYIIRANDIVFARTGSIGRNYFCDKPASTTVFAGYLVKFSINSDIVVPKYVSYYCQSKSYWDQINSLVSGTVMPQINAAKYSESLVIPIISRTQQQHIVNTIGSVDDLIENFITKREKTYIIGAKLYKSNILKNTETLKVRDLNIKYGKTLPKSKRVFGHFPLLASNGIIDFINEHNAKDAIVFGCRGTLGNVFYQTGNCFVLNTAFYLTDRKNYGNLFFALREKNGLVFYKSGAAQPQITIDAIKNAELEIPKDTKLNNMLDLIAKYDDIISMLKIIKENLLNKYF